MPAERNTSSFAGRDVRITRSASSGEPTAGPPRLRLRWDLGSVSMRGKMTVAFRSEATHDCAELHADPRTRAEP